MVYDRGARLLAACWLFLCAREAVHAQDRPAPTPEAKTLVSVQMSKLPAARAVQELATASGISITTADPNALAGAPDVTLTAEKQPFWVVMQDFLRQSGLAATATRTRGVPAVQLAKSQANQSSPPQSAVGPFVYFAGGAVRTQAISYAQPGQVQDSTIIRIRTLIDPKLACIAYSEAPTLTEALDDKGNSLVSPERLKLRPPMVRADTEICSVEFSIPLDARSPAATSVKSIKGTARFQLVTREDVWEVKDIITVTGTSKEFRGGKYTIGSLTPDPLNTSQYILMLHVDWDPAIVGRSALASPLVELGAIRSVIHISDAAGRPLQMRGSNTRNNVQGSRDLNIYYYMAAPPDDPTAVASRLEWRIPAELVTVEIPLELRDLALP